MTQQNERELGKQGDAQAIATLINSSLQPNGITAKAALKDGNLQVMLESGRVINQQEVVPLIRDAVSDLGSKEFKKVKIYARQTGEEFPDWQQEFELKSAKVGHQTGENKKPSVFGAIAGVGGAIGSAVSKAVDWLFRRNKQEDEVKTNSEDKNLQQYPNEQARQGAVKGVAGAIGGAAGQAGKAVAGAAAGVGGAMGGAASKATEGMGYVVDLIANNPQLQNLTKALPMDWLIKLIDQVDKVKAEADVKKLKQLYPNEQPRQIVHRLMLEKAVYVGVVGLASSLVPGAATAMMAVDLAATTKMQAEMVYQIASAYGLDLKDPARKGEVIAIFGLAVGGGKALQVGGSFAAKAGFGFLRNVPVAGAVIGASTNAAMLYALGYSACSFYESKVNSKVNPLNSSETLAATQAETEKYIEGAIAQQVVMDQILVHVILAAYPGKTWKQILPELKTLNLSPVSLEAIAADIKSPPPLESLLNQINRDFAVPLLAQCEKIAQLNGVTTPEEAKVIGTIRKKFGIEIEAIKKGGG